jgi:hypothetical protein
VPPILHPLFLVREGLVVDEDGPRSWAPRTTTASQSVAMIKAASTADVPAYVYDVDGVEAKAAQHSFYQKLEQAHVGPWIHPGCRTAEDAMDAFFAGAEAITVDVRHMPEETMTDLGEIAEGEIHLAAPVDGSGPRPRELARLVGAHGMAGVVLMLEGATDPKRVDAVVAELASLGVARSLLSRRPPGLDLSALVGRVDRWILPPRGG